MRVFKQKYKARNGKTRDSTKWYVEIKDHNETVRRIPGFTDKKATKEFGRRLEKLVATRTMRQPDDPEMTGWLETLPVDMRNRLAKYGLLDAKAVAHAKSLLAHADDFVTSLRNNDVGDDYWKTVGARVRSIINACEFNFISDVSASRVESYMAELKVCGLGQRTVNHYLAAMKQFSKWLVADRRTSENRLTYLKGGNAKLDVRRERRELNDAEIGGLLRAARSGKPICGLTGSQRITLYSTALGTGLRASELASLTPTHFDLAADPSTVAILAPDEKSRRGDVLPLPSDLVRLLSRILSDMPSDARLWPGTWAKSHNGCKLMQQDLEVANVPYKTDEGQADFHALRHTYLSRLGRSGASPKAMQRLARHTTVELTLGKYTHANLYDLASAVDGLPPLPTGSTNDETSGELQATGTNAADKLPANVLPSGLPEKGAPQLPFVQLSATNNQPDSSNSKDTRHNKKTEKTRTKQAFPAANGSGWESNPPGDFSAATLGLKPRAVRPQHPMRRTTYGKRTNVVALMVAAHFRNRSKMTLISPV